MFGLNQSSLLEVFKTFLWVKRHFLAPQRRLVLSAAVLLQELHVSKYTLTFII